MKTLLITGINSGMGFATAKTLIQQGYSVIGTVRSLTKSQKEIHILNSLENGSLTVYEMDLASLHSVKKCAEEIRENNHRLDVCIFNAGIMTPPYSKTINGFESQFQINYLSHFYLFLLLEKSLQEGGKIISISSLSSEKGVNRTIADFEKDIYCNDTDYDGMKCYRKSKLAQVLFTAELHNRYANNKTMSFAIHPGVVNTHLFYREYHPIAKAVIQPLVWLGYATGFIKTAEKGAETAVYLASDSSIQESGRYWADKNIREHNPIANDKAFLKDILGME